MQNAKELCKSLPMGRVFGMLTKSYVGAITKRLEHLEIERYYSVLIIIEGAKEKCTQQYISDSLTIDKVSIVRIMDYLVKKGYIKRTTNSSDRREHIIQLTSKAKGKMKEIHKAIDEMNKATMRRLSKQQEKLIYEGMDIMLENLRQMPAHGVVLNFKKSKKSK